MRIAVPAVLVLSMAFPAPAGAGGGESARVMPVANARGVVRPLNQATISIDLSARVLSIARKEGEAFSKGDVLIEFDCRRHQAELASAEAILREMKLSLESNQFLDRHRAIGKVDIEISRARMDKAAAEAEALRVRLDQCRVVAPFPGRVAELGIFEHETPAPQKPFLTIIEDGVLEIELIVPSEWLGWLSVGSPFTFQVDETKGRYPAHIARIGAAVDAVSQTIKVVGSFQALDGTVKAGMSGEAMFDKPNG